MGHLQDQMRYELERTNYVSTTINNYISAVRLYVAHYRKSPELLNEDHIGRYLHQMVYEKNLSWSSVNSAYSALKFFYTRVLGREWDKQKLPRPRKEKRLPVALSPEEVKTFLDSCKNLKHKTIFMLMYSAGLRPGEVMKLKAEDIDSKQMLIWVRQGKGNKDRRTILSPLMLQVLRIYWKKHRPEGYLFNGLTPGKALSYRTVQVVFTQIKKKSGVNPKATPHSLRHSFATHMLESGVDLLTIKELLGHRNIKTTAVYLHIGQAHLQAIPNPLENLFK